MLCGGGIFGGDIFCGARAEVGGGIVGRGRAEGGGGKDTEF